MKLSNNFIGALIFTALAITVFVFMAIRPAVEGNAMIFGMLVNVDKTTEAAAPASTVTTEIKTEEVLEPAKTEEMDSPSEPAASTEAPIISPPSTTESMPPATEAQTAETVTEPTSVMPTTPVAPVTPAN